MGTVCGVVCLMTWVAMASATGNDGAGKGIVFPPDAGHVDATQPPYSMVGDGKTDNTQAMRQAFEDLRGSNSTLYFPDGVYLLSDRVNISGDQPSQPHSKDRFLNLQGQSEKGTILRLKENSPGFDDADKPKTFISLYEGKSTGDWMHGYIRDLTVEVGPGNPGAAGLRFMANNSGAMYDVTVRSLDPKGAGAIGLDLRQSQNGPALIKRITVEGFDHGIATANTFSLVFEHITLTGQRKAAFDAGNSRLTIRGLRTKGDVPALVGDKHTNLTLIEAQLDGGRSDAAALVLKNNLVYLRDIKVSGFANALQTGDGQHVDGPIDEWHAGQRYALFDSAPRGSLRLPIEEAPDVPWETDLSKWVRVEAGEDRIQAAIDEAARRGATTVYLPKAGKNSYIITRPVRIHGSVNRILGMESILWISKTLPPGATVFTLEDTRGPVVIERFFNILEHGGWKGLRDRFLVENRSDHPLIVRNLAHGACALKQPNPGKTLFLEDVVTHVKIGPGETCWARQLNPESPEADMVTVTGGQMWILGLKTEGRATHIVATNGAKVELLGGVSYQSWKNQPVDPPTFRVVDSQASFTLGFYHWNLPFTTIVEETQGGTTRTLARTQLKPYHLPLYRTAQ